MGTTSKNTASAWAGALDCPFPAALNPHADAAQEWNVHWVKTFGLCPDPKAIEAFRAATVGRLAARNYPDLPREDLCLVGDWYSWLFLLDDERDDQTPRGGRPAGELAALENRLISILRGAPLGSDDGAFARALADLAHRLFGEGREAAADPVPRRRFARALADHLEAGLWEAENRASGRPPSLNSYLEMRPLTGGLEIVTELAWVLEGEGLAQGAIDHPIVARATRASHNAVCWANDLLSLKKELAVGEVNNLVVVLAEERGLTLAEASREALLMHDREVSLLADLLGRLPSSDAPAPRPALERYAGLLRNRVRGVLDWSRENARYRGANGKTADHRGGPDREATQITT